MAAINDPKTVHRKCAFISVILASVAVAFAGSGCSKTPSHSETADNSVVKGTCEADSAGTAKHWKILHIMSYHAPWKWTDDQLSGFKAAMKDVSVEYRVFQMDTKRRSSDEWKKEAALQARELIDTWKPDLVFTNDDNAQELVTKHYVNTEIPFVFCGVNASPEKYGFVGSKNVTGVLEKEHFVETFRLLKQVAPDVKRVAVLFDEGPTWPAVRERMELQLEKLEDIEIVSWDVIKTFDEYKTKVLSCKDSVDAIANIGIFTYEDGDGNNVPYQTVLEWTAKNSTLPDCSFWADRITFGTLCAVTVSGYEQGFSAGKIARQILVDGVSPADIPMQATVKGEPVINLARAKAIGLQLDASTLLGSAIIEHYAWEQ